MEIIEASSDEEPVLRRLMELYLYDFSDFVSMDLNQEGLFGFGEYMDSMYRPPFRNFLALVKGKIVGFAMVCDRSYLTEDDGVHDIAQFFVLRKYRRQGIGEDLAQDMFERFPGRWEVRVMAENSAGAEFWRNVVKGYTRGRFEERAVDNERQRGPVFFFESPGRGGSA